MNKDINTGRFFLNAREIQRPPKTTDRQVSIEVDRTASGLQTWIVWIVSIENICIGRGPAWLYSI